MRKTVYWADAPINREQRVLFARTLDEAIDEDHPVRLIDEVLGELDWSPWEAHYDGRRGQPPIHPRHLAAGLLYGLLRRLRSTRQLEDACVHRIDFIWLLSGRKIDHSTFSKFRTKFHNELKDLFRQLGQLAMGLGLIRLEEVGFDGTRVKANNSRYKTRTAKSLEKTLAGLDALFEQCVAAMEAEEAQEQGAENAEALARRLAELEQAREQTMKALELARAADEARRRKGVDIKKNPAQVPTTDPDSRVMPNKEGGYAANFTPTATTDGHLGMIVDCDVTRDVNETELAVASVDRVTESLGKTPDKLLTDAGNNSGHMMCEMEQRGVEFYAPVKSSQPQPDSPAAREDLSQPVAESERPQLLLNDRGKLDKSCFVYDEQSDTVYCPMGQPMPYEKSKSDRQGSVRINRRVYRSHSCGGCSLAPQCLLSNNTRGRTITRDEFEEVRERTAARMATPEGRELYKQRPRIAETPFGILKHIMGLRQFLLRGLEKVKTEWRWACTAFNLGKIIRARALLRASILAEASQG